MKTENDSPAIDPEAIDDAVRKAAKHHIHELFKRAAKAESEHRGIHLTRTETAILVRAMDAAFEPEVLRKPHHFGCLLCAYGKELPPGEHCRACGKENLN